MTDLVARVLAFSACGRDPQPQGSTRIVPTKRGPRITSDNTRLAAWRGIVEGRARHAARLADWRADPRAAYQVHALYVLTRPRSAPAWRVYPIVRPDVDKLERALLDALTRAGVVVDDAQVVDTTNSKRYAAVGGQAGVHVTVARLD